MKKVVYILFSLLAAACTSFEGNPYGDTLRTLDVQLIYPADYADFLREGVEVRLADRNTSNVYTARTDASGTAAFRVAAGHYRLSSLDRASSEVVFNGVVEQVDLVRSGADLTVELKAAKPGSILIKEVYSGGCPQDPPATGRYMYDQYVVLHNNSFDTYYLDGLCFTTVAPDNSNANSNPWTSTDGSGNLVFDDFAAAIESLWQFPGSGRDFPLEPGQDVVVAFRGVDHTQTYSQSVNLNREECFVLYDQALYPGSTSNPTPAPGDRIDPARVLRNLKKTGRSNTYIMSLSSPAVAIFRAPDDFDLDAYLSDDQQSTVQNGSVLYSKIPWEWIIDGVDVCNRSAAQRLKRLRTDVDSDFAAFSGTSLGHTVHRLPDEEATAAAGFEILMDTNNSSNDFYERETQSLRESL